MKGKDEFGRGSVAFDNGVQGMGNGNARLIEFIVI
jgi:hypothetical protein